MCTGCLTFYTGVDQDPLEMYGKTNQKDYSCIASGPSTSSDPVWVPPDSIKYREIKGEYLFVAAFEIIREIDLF